MRKLIYVPMLHSTEAIEADRENKGEFLTDISVERAKSFSPKFWEVVGEGLDRFGEVSHARFYVESCDSQIEFQKGETSSVSQGELQELAPEKIIVEFMQKVGGVLEPTDDRKLIEATFAATKEIDDVFRAAKEKDVAIEEGLDLSDEEIKNAVLGFIDRAIPIARRLGELSDKRDEHIAGRIESTLKDGETGFLFLGGGHKVTSLLSDDINVELLDERLPEIIREATRPRYEDDDEDEGEPLEPIGGSEVKG